MTGDFYVPRKIVSVDFVGSKADPQYRGKPSVQKIKELVKLEYNEPVDQKAFRLTPPEGVVVFDVSKMPLDLDGNPIDIGKVDEGLPYVAYIQPANPSDIGKAIETAKSSPLWPPVLTPGATGRSLDLRKDSNTPQTPDSFRWFIAANVLIALFAGGYLVWKRVRN